LEAEAELNFDIEFACAGEGEQLAWQLAAVFIRTQDWTNRAELCQRLVAYRKMLPDPSQAFGHAPIYLLVTNGLPLSLVREAITWARVDPGEIDRFNASAIPPDDPTLGMASYRAGDFEQALQALKLVSHPTSVGNEGTAMAFRAMCLHELGREGEAREVLQQVESLLATPLKNLAGDNWYRLAFAQTALEEAQALIRQNEAARGASK
jgi:hypothetical protein